MKQLLEIKNFLLCDTPQEWVDVAIQNINLLLIDHAHCEKKAASTAMSLIYRYVDRSELLRKLSQLAREELLHFEQVLDIMRDRKIEYRHLTPSRYASGLRTLVRTHEPARLVDILIVGAFVEARSCERFDKLAPYLDEELAKFYRSLLRSEGRHYEDYLRLAELYSDSLIDDRIKSFAEKERELILSKDGEFRFHSGIPEKF
ncbi:MAG: tRNA-(ms[2]io[6]A)-hydroxylase [Pseudomonadales bacterium]|nr:tRNA-(ms[2]io[6]A)-hydroxylase [Pseudomonadales bacterium]